MGKILTPAVGKAAAVQAAPAAAVREGMRTRATDDASEAEMIVLRSENESLKRELGSLRSVDEEEERHPRQRRRQSTERPAGVQPVVSHERQIASLNSQLNHLAARAAEAEAAARDASAAKAQAQARVAWGSNPRAWREAPRTRVLKCCVCSCGATERDGGVRGMSRHNSRRRMS